MDVAKVAMLGASVVWAALGGVVQSHRSVRTVV